MPAEPAHGQVIVVGAGPVGMSAALLLASFGVRTTVLEAQASPVAEPKAISIDDESLRTYALAGVADRVMSVVVPGTGTMYYGADRRPLFQASGPALFRHGFPFKNPFAQPDLERVLRELLEASPLVEIRYGSRVVGLEPQEGQVEIVAEELGGPRRVTADYVIGADGGRSTVRRLLGITMTGRSYRDDWLVVDTLEDAHDERYAMHFGTPERPHVIVAGREGRCRYELYLHPGEAAPGPDPDFGLIERLMAPFRAISPEQVERAVVYRFNGLNADRWRLGRTFLAGDAAHMMPPFAGQGLNSGIRDVANLCWKLAAVLQGRLDRSALDTYESERRPHAAATIRLSERLGRTVMSTRPRVAAARDRIVTAMLEDPEGRAYLEQMRYRPLAHMDAGLVWRPERPGVGRVIGQPRGYDVSASRVRMLDELLGRGWGLMGIGVPPGSWAASAPVRAHVDARAVHVVTDQTFPAHVDDATVFIDVDSQLAGEFDQYRGRYLLIRPDRFVAASWEVGEEADVRDWLSRWAPMDTTAAV